jgi:hypothetical protein
MLAFLLGLFRLVWLFGKDNRGVVLENLALRQQISIYKRKRPPFVDRDRWFCEAKLRALHETTVHLTSNSTRGAEVLRHILEDKKVVAAAASPLQASASVFCLTVNLHKTYGAISAVLRGASANRQSSYEYRPIGSESS